MSEACQQDQDDVARHTQRLALAILNSGASYRDAMQQTGLSLQTLLDMWATHGQPRLQNVSAEAH